MNPMKALYPQPVSTFNLEAQRMLNNVTRDPILEARAIERINHEPDSARLLEMLGLK
jgi:hypothetical protein